MNYPDYVKHYIDATKVSEEYKNVKYKKEIEEALGVFAKKIRSSAKERSPGNRTFIASAVTPFLQKLFEDKCDVEPEKNPPSLPSKRVTTKSTSTLAAPATGCRTT